VPCDAWRAGGFGERPRAQTRGGRLATDGSRS